MGGTFWVCAKPRYSCRKGYRGKWKSMWYFGCEGRFVLWGRISDRKNNKAMEDNGIKWGGKPLLDLDYADDLRILDESVAKMNEFASSGC